MNFNIEDFVNSMPAEQLQEILDAKIKKEAQERQQARNNYENFREETISALISNAAHLSSQLSAFKLHSFDKMQQLYTKLKQHSKRHQDGKGNFEVISKDKRNKVVFKRQDTGRFDERCKQAEAHIISFVNKQFSNDESTRKLIMSLLERRHGTLDVKLVQKLYAMEDQYSDPEWREGLRLLKESWTSDETCEYLTFYVKGKNEQWELLHLNFASV